MIYIASPYTHNDPSIERERFEQVRFYATYQMQRGVVCFSPVVYGRQFHVAGHLRGDFKTWAALNDDMICAASLMEVLMLPGWDNSVGVMHEIERAQELDLNLRFVDWSPLYESL